MNIKTNITHQSSQTITQITKRYFSYQLFVIGAVMTKACGGSSGDGGASAILINGSAPIATAGIMDVTGADLIDTSGDDTYLIDYGQGSGTIELQVNPFDGEVGASGYDTVLVQGYSGAGFNPLVTVGFILIKTAGYPDIEFAFPNSDIFERFVFDVGDVDGNVDVDGNGDGLINGSDFVWLIGYKNENYEIEGTDVKDYIRGGEGDDTINGFAGDDEIYGRAGDDTINGGDGDDIINGGADDDTIHGDAGNDTISGSDGDDTLYGGGGDDNIIGDAGNDTILGGEGNDEISGQGGNDTIYGDAGNDLIFGNAGDDTVLDGGAGDDIIYGGTGDDTIDGGAGDDKISYYKGEGHDIIDGGAGNEDVLILRRFVEDDILSLERTGDDLKLNFKDTALGEDGGSIILKNSVNDTDAGIDSILFDTNGDGIKDTVEDRWLDEEFAYYLSLPIYMA